MITHDQCRAARALLDWTQEDLEASSMVAKRRIAEFERGGAIPHARTLGELQAALELGGVIFIPENGGGAGVRRREAIPRLARKKISRWDRLATLHVNYRGREWTIELPTEILDDIDRTNHPTDAALDASVDAHINMILMRTAQAIDAGRGGDAQKIVFTDQDFPEAR